MTKNEKLEKLIKANGEMVEVDSCEFGKFEHWNYEGKTYELNYSVDGDLTSIEEIELPHYQETKLNTNMIRRTIQTDRVKKLSNK